MKILCRTSIRPMKRNFPYDSPDYLLKKAMNLLNRYEEFIVSKDMMLLLIPVESLAYKEIIEFQKENSDYFNEQQLRYEKSFTKAEIENAEYLELHVSSTLCGYSDTTMKDYFRECCYHNEMYGNQYRSYEIPPKEWGSKTIALADIGKFFISSTLKIEYENNMITNVRFDPAFARKDFTSPIAYQLSVYEKMPPIFELNPQFVKYKSCSGCKKITYYDKGYLQTTISRDILHQLHDFNESTEEFTELNSHIYIISQKLHKLMSSTKVKGLKCEPVKIVER